MNHLENISFYQLWAVVGLSIILRFAVFGFGGYALFYMRRATSLKRMKIQKKFPSVRMLKYEIKQSLINLVLLGLLSSVVLFLFRTGNNQLYKEVSEYGVLYFIGSIVLMMLIHDTWFYWLHRLIHLPMFYKTFHATHHKSVNPTPFTSFSMDRGEMILEFAIFPIIVLAVPMHPLAFAIFVFISFIFNIIGHLGYEIFPKKFLNSKIGGFINSGTKHNIHHKQFLFNYSYYFTFWDKLMDTESTKINN
jgi:sterol desaturase/sphingolipid hydroxylase (fatty acid hydroxylase superfamily)